MPIRTAPDFIDLHFLGQPEVIATAVLRGPGGVALVDPGPSTTLERLSAGLADRGIGLGDVRQLLITHIHLDHSGAAGTILRDHPHVDVYVHERGAPHLVDPSKLLASAGRLYGADMDRLWGEILPVPADRVRTLAGGETFAAVGGPMSVAYTPGHASHHVTFFDPSTGVAFVGDTAGIRRPGPGAEVYVMPPTPPPDIDLEIWQDSIDRILAWEPAVLFLTHFGAYEDAQPQFEALRARLDLWSRSVRNLLADAGLDDAERERRFLREATAELEEAVGTEQAGRYAKAARIDYSWQGLARYWRKRS